MNINDNLNLCAKDLCNHKFENKDDLLKYLFNKTIPMMIKNFEIINYNSDCIILINNEELILKELQKELHLIYYTIKTKTTQNIIKEVIIKLHLKNIYNSIFGSNKITMTIRIYKDDITINHYLSPNNYTFNNHQFLAKFQNNIKPFVESYKQQYNEGNILSVDDITTRIFYYTAEQFINVP